MMRLAWATDIHLNFLDEAGRARFRDEVAAADAGALVITGDIAEAPSFESLLGELAAGLSLPLYFVLGNHDFYRGTFVIGRAHAEAVAAARPTVVWLTQAGVVPLGERTALVGHDGWYDARLGNYEYSPVAGVLTDFRLIRDLVGLDHAARRAKLEALGDEAAAHARRTVPAALARYEHVVFATHVPPFAEAAWHEGEISDPHWLPFFSCRAMGDALLEAAAARPDRQLTVLCGHTHGGGVTRPAPNVLVKTGGAEYGKPRLEEVLALP